MPRFNGTGPQGLGANTGRGLGPCGKESDFYGRGFRKGFGQRFGRRGIYKMNLDVNQQDEQKILETELKEIENEKQAISKRIEELKKS